MAARWPGPETKGFANRVRQRWALDALGSEGWLKEGSDSNSFMVPLHEMAQLWEARQGATKSIRRGTQTK